MNNEEKWFLVVRGKPKLSISHFNDISNYCKGDTLVLYKRSALQKWYNNVFLRELESQKPLISVILDKNHYLMCTGPKIPSYLG